MLLHVMLLILWLQCWCRGAASPHCVQYSQQDAVQMQHLLFFFFFSSRKISEDDVIALLLLHGGPSPYMQPAPGCITLQMRFHLAFTFPLLYKF